VVGPPSPSGPASRSCRSMCSSRPSRVTLVADHVDVCPARRHTAGQRPAPASRLAEVELEPRWPQIRGVPEGREIAFGYPAHDDPAARLPGAGEPSGVTRVAQATRRRSRLPRQRRQRRQVGGGTWMSGRPRLQAAPGPATTIAHRGGCDIPHGRTPGRGPGPPPGSSSSKHVPGRGPPRSWSGYDNPDPHPTALGAHNRSHTARDVGLRHVRHCDFPRARMFGYK